MTTFDRPPASCRRGRRVRAWISAATLALAAGTAFAGVGDPIALRFATSAFGSTVAYLDNVPSGCVAAFDTTVNGDASAFAITTTSVMGPCGVPPAGVTSLHVDLGIQPPGTYAVTWTYTGGGAAQSGAFTVAPPLAAYVTPRCPFDHCVATLPSEPTTDEPFTLSFNMDSNSFPRCMEVLDAAATVVDNVIRVTGTQTPRPDCIPVSPPPPGHALSVDMPPLPAGTYSAVLYLASTASPPQVYTINGIVDAQIFVPGELTVLTPEQSSMVQVVEYYYPPYDHYFLTADANEIAVLDARVPPFQDWVRTGYSFRMYKPDAIAPPAGAAEVCRFYNDSFAPKSSHFYAARGFGCEETLAAFPDWKLETGSAFVTVIPAENGECPSGIGVYRLYNNGMGGAPNHRFTIDAGERQRMITLGWVPEGYGPGIAMCSPL
ncbi:MAG: hypothetical protein JSR18_16160 [Proteobacteria bacterium]|nr:hypothetical protein [Pseudomonadota bacterium]